MYSPIRSRSTDFKDHLISHYDGLPDIGTVFAILVENKYFRAIRTHSEVSYCDKCDSCSDRKFIQIISCFVQSTLISYQVTLIDVGETISMPLYRSEKYQLSPDASQLPPMAILCLVEKVHFARRFCLLLLLHNMRFISGRWDVDELFATSVGRKTIQFPNCQHMRVSVVDWPFFFNYYFTNKFVFFLFVFIFHLT